jgi:hypothetical protein
MPESKHWRSTLLMAQPVTASHERGPSLPARGGGHRTVQARQRAHRLRCTDELGKRRATGRDNTSRRVGTSFRDRAGTTTGSC